MLADVGSGTVDDADAAQTAGVCEGELDGWLRVRLQLELPEAWGPLAFLSGLELIVVAFILRMLVLDV